MGKDASSVDFFVDVINAGPFAYTNDKVTGRLKNFGTEVQSTDSTKTVKLPKYTISAPATTVVKLVKKFQNTMDYGEV